MISQKNYLTKFNTFKKHPNNEVFKKLVNKFMKYTYLESYLVVKIHSSIFELFQILLLTLTGNIMESGKLNSTPAITKSTPWGEGK